MQVLCVYDYTRGMYILKKVGEGTRMYIYSYGLSEFSKYIMYHGSDRGRLCIFRKPNTTYSYLSTIEIDFLNHKRNLRSIFELPIGPQVSYK